MENYYLNSQNVKMYVTAGAIIGSFYGCAARDGENIFLLFATVTQYTL